MGQSNFIGQVGFRFNNGIVAIGPIAIFPRSVLSWNVKDHNDISPESLSLFCSLDPKIGNIFQINILYKKKTCTIILFFFYKYRCSKFVKSIVGTSVKS